VLSNPTFQDSIEKMHL